MNDEQGADFRQQQALEEEALYELRERQRMDALDAAQAAREVEFIAQLEAKYPQLLAAWPTRSKK